MTEDNQHGGETTRRAALAGAGLAGAALLAACSSGSGSSGSSGSSSSSSSSVSSYDPMTGQSLPSGTPTSDQSLGSASDVPVGGGHVYSTAKVVVTQPEAGTYMGFSAVCTHMQCLVDQVAKGTIDCPCHGSRYSIKDGSVVQGPAPSGLPPVKVTVANGKITMS